MAEARREAAEGHGRHRQLPAMLKVGTIGFGGGSALIPVMEKELVSPRALSEKVFVQDTVIANITPGALPVKIAALSGIQLGGPALATMSALIVALPGTAITVGLLAAFALLGSAAIRVVEYASLGITAFILFLLAHYVHRVISTGGHRRLAYILIAVAAYLVTGADKTAALVAQVSGRELELALPELSALGLILLAVGAIALYSVWQHLRRRSEPFRDTSEPPAQLRRTLVAIGVFIVLTGLGIAGAFVFGDGEAGGFLALVTGSTMSSFGGGEAYVGVADGFFVAPGLIPSEVFYGQLVPVANALPGPILVKIAAGMGYVLGLQTGGWGLGLGLAAAAYLASIGSCCALALGVLAGYDKARHSIFVQNIASFILPVICGLLASTAVAMLQSNVRIGGEAGIPAAAAVAGSVLLAIVVALAQRRRVPDLVLILASGGLSLGLLLLV